MVVGTGLYAFFIQQSVACWLMLCGSILFVIMQMRQKYLGESITIRRLRKIMCIANIGFILAGLFMVENSYCLLKPLFVKYIEITRIMSPSSETTGSYFCLFLP